MTGAQKHRAVSAGLALLAGYDLSLASLCCRYQRPDDALVYALLAAGLATWAYRRLTKN